MSSRVWGRLLRAPSSEKRQFHMLGAGRCGQISGLRLRLRQAMVVELEKGDVKLREVYEGELLL